MLGATLAAPVVRWPFTLLGFLLPPSGWPAACCGPASSDRPTDWIESRRNLQAAVLLGVWPSRPFSGSRSWPPMSPAWTAPSTRCSPRRMPDPRRWCWRSQSSTPWRRALLPGCTPSRSVGDHRAAVATAVYVLATVATLNMALVLAAAAMGTVFMVELLATRAILAPTLTHITWSTLVLLAIPG